MALRKYKPIATPALAEDHTGIRHNKAAILVRKAEIAIAKSKKLVEASRQLLEENRQNRAKFYVRMP
jgi:hypothetical protein